jgi:WhiB family transcriptional regulator, redox-sensing transcriptional regulator
MTASIAAVTDVQAASVEQLPEIAPDVAVADTIAALSTAVDVREDRRVRCRPSPASGARRGARARSPVGGSPEPIGRRSPVGLPCQVSDPDLWFAEAPADLEFAKALCAGCPAQRMCLAGAIERREPCGVWGGQIFHHGRIVPYKRSRGRPRKDSTPYPMQD